MLEAVPMSQDRLGSKFVVLKFGGTSVATKDR
jgi:aspartokinase